MLIFELLVGLSLPFSYISDVLFKFSILLDLNLSQMLLLKTPKSVFFFLLLLFELCFFKLLLSLYVNLFDLIWSKGFKVVWHISMRSKSRDSRVEMLVKERVLLVTFSCVAVES